ELTPEDPNLYFGRGNAYSALNNYSAAIADGDKAVYYSSLNNPLYEAYNDHAKDTGFKSAETFYRSQVEFWRVSDDSDINKKMDDLYEQALKNSDTAMINFCEDEQRKKKNEQEKLMKRREL